MLTHEKELREIPGVFIFLRATGSQCSLICFYLDDILGKCVILEEFLKSRLAIASVRNNLKSTTSTTGRGAWGGGCLCTIRPFWGSSAVVPIFVLLKNLNFANANGKCRWFLDAEDCKHIFEWSAICRGRREISEYFLQTYKFVKNGCQCSIEKFAMWAF